MINNQIKKINTVDEAVSASLNNIKKIIFPPVSTVLPSNSFMSLMGVPTSSKSSQPAQPTLALPNNVEDPAILKAMAPILSVNLGQGIADSVMALTSFSPTNIIDTPISLNPLSYFLPSTNSASETTSQTTTTTSTATSEKSSVSPMVEATINSSTSLNSSTTITKSLTTTSAANVVITTTTLPNVDWSNKTGPVRYQGACGACYAFTTVQVLEMCTATFLMGGLYLQLSAQQVLDCSPTVTNYNGCNGGLI